MKKKNTGTQYEKLVQEIYQSILNYDTNAKGINSITVQHNVSLLGKSGNTHQIDVYWEFEMAGIKHMTIVEAKDWQTPVKQEQVHSFKTVLDDIPGTPCGIYVSRGGFQSGAKTFAAHHGIKLMQIGESKDGAHVSVRYLFKQTHYASAVLWIDEGWWAEQPQFFKDVIDCCPKRGHEKIWLINPAGERVRLYDLLCIDATPYYWEDDGQSFYIDKHLDGEWYWDTELPDGTVVKITGYEFECYNTSSCYHTELVLQNIADVIVSDIQNNQIKHYYPDRNIIRKSFNAKIEVYNKKLFI